jgi:hypothetical protein
MSNRPQTIPLTSAIAEAAPAPSQYPLPNPDLSSNPGKKLISNKKHASNNDRMSNRPQRIPPTSAIAEAAPALCQYPLPNPDLSSNPGKKLIPNKKHASNNDRMSNRPQTIPPTSAIAEAAPAPCQYPLPNPDLSSNSGKNLIPNKNMQATMTG